MQSRLNGLPDDVYRLVYSFLRPDIMDSPMVYASLFVCYRTHDKICQFEQIEMRCRHLVRKYRYTLDAARRHNSPYLTIPTLKAHCKENGIKRYTKMNRKELIQALMKI